MDNVKIEECEVCMELFPLDCFEFFPCAHKICFFCFNKLKQLQCPYCRINMDVETMSESGNQTLETIGESGESGESGVSGESDESGESSESEYSR